METLFVKKSRKKQSPLQKNKYLLEITNKKSFFNLEGLFLLGTGRNKLF